CMKYRYHSGSYNDYW
nr:immunoglobulin heavy chain junction region [Macaca mulatta]